MEDTSVTDVVNIEDVKVIEGDVTSRHKEISRKIFGYLGKSEIPQATSKLEKKEESKSIYASCDIVKTRIGICIIAGVLFLLFFILSPIDNILIGLGMNGITLLLVKGVLFCFFLYIVLYKLDICIT